MSNPKIKQIEMVEFEPLTLIEAIREDRPEIVQHIVQYRLAITDIINKADSHGQAPLHIAASLGHTECVKALLKIEGIKVNQPDNGGWTPLHYTALCNRTECLKVLLAVKGIEVNQENSERLTPLNMAIDYGSIEFLMVLLAVEGIEVNKEDNYGNTALQNEAARGRTVYVKALLAVEGIEVNQENNNGWTPLHYAVRTGCTECVQVLLKAKGINANCANKHGQTPLHLAAGIGNTEITQLLLQQPGIDISVRNAANKTAKDIACQERQPRNEGLINLLQACQANPEWYDSNTKRMRYNHGHFMYLRCNTRIETAFEKLGILGLTSVAFYYYFREDTLLLEALFMQLWKNKRIELLKAFSGRLWPNERMELLNSIEKKIALDLIVDLRSFSLASKTIFKHLASVETNILPKELMIMQTQSSAGYKFFPTLKPPTKQKNKQNKQNKHPTEQTEQKNKQNKQNKHPTEQTEQTEQAEQAEQVSYLIDLPGDLKTCIAQYLVPFTPTRKLLLLMLSMHKSITQWHEQAERHMFYRADLLKSGKTKNIGNTKNM